MARTIFLLLFGMIVFQSSGQQIRSKIPYRVVGGKMIVEMNVNGMPRSFIFDTGGRTALTGELCEELGLVVKDSMVVTDVNGNKGGYPLVRIKSLMTLDGVINFTDVPAMKLPEPSPFVCFHADGLIGSELFAKMQAIVEIDGKTNTITITSAENPSAISLRKMIPFAQGGGMPIISIQAGIGEGVNVLFDTGCPGFLSLKDTDFERLKDKGVCSVLSEGFGEGSIGVAGMADAAKAYRILFPRISVGATKFNHVTVETSTPPFTLLGMKLLNYGKVTIDYPRGRFYFEAYEQENDLTSKHYDVNLRVKDGNLVVSTVWSAMKGLVEVGDQVTRINGKPTGTYDFCESIINGIPELKAKKKAKLTVRTKDGEKVIIYEKK